MISCSILVIHKNYYKFLCEIRTLLKKDSKCCTYTLTSTKQCIWQNNYEKSAACSLNHLLHIFAIFKSKNKYATEENIRINLNHGLFTKCLLKYIIFASIMIIRLHLRNQYHYLHLHL